MTLQQTIDQDLIQAMKAKDLDKATVLRGVKAAFNNYLIEKKQNTLADADAVQILQKQVKMRRESIDSFTKANRNDLADKETKELGVLEKYLPKQMSDDEIRALVQKAIAATGAKTKQDAGKVMKELMPQTKGKADGKRVNEILLSLLA